MAKRGKMQRTVMYVLATMLLLSFVLAVASFVEPTKAYAEICVPERQWRTLTWEDWCCQNWHRHVGHQLQYRDRLPDCSWTYWHNYGGPWYTCDGSFCIW